MITISGVDVGQRNGKAPTLYDIGYSLIQVPRFGGHTTRPWNVLNHLYACYWYALQKGLSLKTQIYALLHDAHESITSDIPQPWKTDGMRVIQRELDARIYASLGLGMPPLDVERAVHRIDNQMVYAEAKAFAPQVAAAIRAPGDNYRDSINPLDEIAEEAVRWSEEWLSGLGPVSAGYDFEELFTVLKGKL